MSLAGDSSGACWGGSQTGEVLHPKDEGSFNRPGIVPWEN